MPTALRAEYVAEEDMAKLTSANGKVVQFRGVSWLLRLDNTIPVISGEGKNNIVKLDPGQTANAKETDSDYEEVLSRLNFLER